MIIKIKDIILIFPINLGNIVVPDDWNFSHFSLVFYQCVDVGNNFYPDIVIATCFSPWLFQTLLFVLSRKLKNYWSFLWRFRFLYLLLFVLHFQLTYRLCCCVKSSNLAFVITSWWIVVTIPWIWQVAWIFPTRIIQTEIKNIFLVEDSINQRLLPIVIKEGEFLVILSHFLSHSGMGVQLSSSHGFEMRSYIKNEDLMVVMVETNQILLGSKEISDRLSERDGSFVFEYSSMIEDLERKFLIFFIVRGFVEQLVI